MFPPKYHLTPSLRRRLDHQVSLHEQSDHSISNPSTLVDSVLPLAGPAQAQAGLEALRNLSETEEKLKQASHASSGGLASERQFWDANEELFSALKALDGVRVDWILILQGIC